MNSSVLFPDLFGFVPVSLRELELWLYKVPRMAHYQRGRQAYIRNYSVVEKIQRAKLAGTLDQALGDCRCEFCGQELAQEQIENPAPVSPTDELQRLRRRVEVLELVIQAQASAAIQPRQAHESLRARLPAIFK